MSFPSSSGSQSRSKSQFNTKMKTSPNASNVKNLGRPKIYLQHTCYICGNAMSGGTQTINHIKAVHGYEIPSRAVGYKRPQDNDQEYVRDMSNADVLHYACPSCWFHCPEDDLEALNEHTLNEHDPVKVDITKDNDLVSKRPTRMRSNSASSNRSNSFPRSAPIEQSDVNQINQKLDELIKLFSKFYKQ